MTLASPHDDDMTAACDRLTSKWVRARYKATHEETYLCGIAQTMQSARCSILDVNELKIAYYVV